MALVLCDGGPSSLRAVDAACVPGFLIPKHEGEQIVMVHGFYDSKDPASYAPVSATIEHINGNRVAQNTLNYKLEMAKVPGKGDGSRSTPTPTTSPSAQTPVPGATSPASPAPPAAPEKPTPSGKKGAKAAAAAAAAAPADPAGDADGGDPLTPQFTGPDPIVAKTLAEYVDSRTAHHKGCNSILLGAGNSQQGKMLAIGSVAKEMISRFSGKLNIFCLKASGPLIRPTAAMRMMVLVIPGVPLSHLQYALSVANVEGKADRVGVMIVTNNGKPKPEEGVMSVAAVDEFGVPSPHEMAKRCSALQAAAGLSDGPPPGVDDATIDAPSSAAQDAFPLITNITLEPTNQVATPTVSEAGSQIVKAVSGLKVDFLVLPAGTEGVTDAFVQLALSAPKPHMLIPACPPSTQDDEEDDKDQIGEAIAEAAQQNEDAKEQEEQQTSSVEPKQ